MARVFTLSQNDYGKQTRWAQAPNENPSVQNLKNPSVQNLKIVQNLKNKEKNLFFTMLTDFAKDIPTRFCRKKIKISFDNPDTNAYYDTKKIEQ